MQAMVLCGVGFSVVLALKGQFQNQFVPQVQRGGDRSLSASSTDSSFGKDASSPETNTAEIDRERFREQLSLHEGRRNLVYLDSEGIPTVGVGFNLNRADAREKIEALGLDYDKVRSGEQQLNAAQMDRLLVNDSDAAIREAKSIFPNFKDLSEVRQRVIADMIFNLGRDKFLGFTDTISAIQAGEFDKAANEMVNSLWYNQVKTRGERLVEMMRTGRDYR
jgi:GH24 family phage-related lysozyme (muramidase)